MHSEEQLGEPTTGRGFEQKNAWESLGIKDDFKLKIHSPKKSWILHHCSVLWVSCFFFLISSKRCFFWNKRGSWGVIYRYLGKIPMKFCQISDDFKLRSLH